MSISHHKSHHGHRWLHGHQDQHSGLHFIAACPRTLISPDAHKSSNANRAGDIIRVAVI
jgi:hypothetical protein